MEFLGKKRENINIKIKTFSKNVNKHQNKKKIANFKKGKNFLVINKDSKNDFH